MKRCIYCRKEKCDSEFSLEHVIPQFLGGAYAPEYLKTKDVCKRCNNNLGLFVDAAFEKDFFVYNNLNSSARAFFDPEKPCALPLQCLGQACLSPKAMEDYEVCECWVGPLGETVLWIRPNDESMYWYTGGNPIRVKKQESRAYFICSNRSPKNLALTLLTFKEAFSGKPVKKVMCTKIIDLEVEQFGFSQPDALDLDRIAYFLEEYSGEKEQENQLLVNVGYDHRFLAKISIGIAYCLFGEKVLNTSYGIELNKALWYREGIPIPAIIGHTPFLDMNKSFNQFCGVPYGVAVTVHIACDSVFINLNINQQLNWSVKCADLAALSDEDIALVGKEGLCLLLYRALGKRIELSVTGLIAHITGTVQNNEIFEVESKLNQCSGYFENL